MRLLVPISMINTLNKMTLSSKPFSKKIAIFCFENFAKISGVGEIRYHNTYIKNGKGHYIIGHGGSFGTNFSDKRFEQNYFELKTFSKISRKIMKNTRVGKNCAINEKHAA